MNRSDLQKVATPREALLALMAILALMIFFLRVFYIPRSQMVTSMAGEAKELRSKRESISVQLNVLKTQQAQKIASFEKSSNIRLQILKGETKSNINNITSIIETISGADFHQGLILYSLSAQPPKIQSGYQETAFNVKARGPYERMAPFLEKFDSLPALIAMDAVEITRTVEVAGEMDVSLDVTLYQLEDSHGSMASQKK